MFGLGAADSVSDRARRRQTRMITMIIISAATPPADAPAITAVLDADLAVGAKVGFGKRVIGPMIQDLFIPGKSRDEITHSNVILSRDTPTVTLSDLETAWSWFMGDGSHDKFSNTSTGI